MFGLCAVAFAAMYLYAELTLDHGPRNGVVVLRWNTDDNPARDQQIAGFATQYPGLAAKVDPRDSADGTMKVLVQCATGAGPDLIDTGADDVATFVSAGLLLDLTPYAKSMGFDPSKTYPSLLGALEVDGRQYVFPANVSANAVIYNKQVFDDHGVPYPEKHWTYADFLKTCKMLQDRPSKTGKKLIVIANYSNIWMFEDLLIDHGGRCFSADGLRSALDSPEAIAAMQDYYDLMHVYKYIPTPSEGAAMSGQGGWGAGGLEWFSNGEAAMIPIARWYTVQVPHYPQLRGHLGVALFPSMNGRSADMAVTRATGINAKSPHWQESLKFLQYLAGPAYGRQIVEDGDSLPPSPSLGSGEALKNEMVPDPAFHEPFVEQLKYARPLDYSPYIDATETTRWIQETVDKVENKVQTPREAMLSLARQIDATISENLARRPDLRRRASDSKHP